MSKIYNTLIIIALTITVLLSGTSFSVNSQSGEVLDTTRIYQLVFDGRRLEAAEQLSKLLNNRQVASNDHLASEWLKAALFYALGNAPDKAASAYQKYLAYEGVQQTNPTNRSNSLFYHALLLLSKESYNQAADSLLTSIAIRPSSGDMNQLLRADSYGELARLYKRIGDLSESTRSFDRSISLNRDMGRVLVLAEDLSDESSVLAKMSKWDTKIDTLLTESLSIFIKQEKLKKGGLNFPLKISQVYTEFGYLHFIRGSSEKALAYYTLSLREKKRIPGLNPRELIVVNNNIGGCYLSLHKNDSARFYFLKAADYAVRTGESPADYYVNLGVIDGKEKKYDEALMYFQKALQCLDSVNCTSDLSTNPDVNHVTPLLADHTAYKAHTFHKRYSQYRDPKDLYLGLNTFMVALDMMDTLRFKYSFKSKPYLSSENKIFYYKALDMALELYARDPQQAYLEQAFQLSERNKSAILNEFLRTNQARKYLGKVAPWIKTEDSLKQVIDQLESKLVNPLSEIHLKTDSIKAVHTKITLLSDELRSLGMKARKENPEFFRQIYSDRGYSPKEIQDVLIPGEALIDYTIVWDEGTVKNYMAIMVLTRDTFFTYRDTLPDHFNKDLTDFRATITPYVDSHIFQEFCRLSYQMYNYFIAPIEKFKGVDKLIILPDEQLGFLPFEVFISDTIKPKGSDFRKLSYLNKKYQISYISSHEQLHQFRKSTKKATQPIIYTFAPFAKEGAKVDTLDLFALGNSAQETRYISQLFKSKIYENRKAGEQTIRRVFQKESVINLSTHGIMDTLHPMQSRLLLNPAQPDGSLYLFEIMSLKISSSLVILNACNTGTGQLQVGEGILSIARGFQYAGVPSVITTMWPIDDQSSATVMKYFFKNIYDGMDQRKALMKARNMYIDHSNKATGAPYFWAGQILIGDPGYLSIKHRNQIPITAIILVFLCLSSILAIVLHKKAKH